MVVTTNQKSHANHKDVAFCRAHRTPKSRLVGMFMLLACPSVLATRDGTKLTGSTSHAGAPKQKLQQGFFSVIKKSEAFDPKLFPEEWKIDDEASQSAANHPDGRQYYLKVPLYDEEEILRMNLRNVNRLAGVCPFGRLVLEDAGETLENIHDGLWSDAHSNMSLPTRCKDVVKIFLDIASGIEALHENDIWHRDLHENNICSRQAASGEWEATIIDVGMSLKKQHFLEYESNLVKMFNNDEEMKNPRRLQTKYHKQSKSKRSVEFYRHLAEDFDKYVKVDNEKYVIDCEKWEDSLEARWKAKLSKDFVMLDYFPAMLCPVLGLRIAGGSKRRRSPFAPKEKTTKRKPCFTTLNMDLLSQGKNITHEIISKVQQQFPKVDISPLRKILASIHGPKEALDITSTKGELEKLYAAL